MTAEIKYTIINHVAREELGLSWIEYGLADLIYHLSASNSGDYPGWCYASKETLAKSTGISKRQIHRMLLKLEELNLIEKHPQTRHVRTTKDWYDKIIIKDSDKMSQGVPKRYTQGQNVTPNSDKMSHNKDNNNDKENTSYKRKTPEHKKRNWLLSIPLEEQEKFVKKYAATYEQIKSKAEDLYYWAQSKDVRGRDWRATLHTACKKDFGLKDASLFPGAMSPDDPRAW